MTQIEIDFEVFKALTAKRSSENHSFNAVLREMLHLSGGGATDGADSRPNKAGRILGARFLPNGTKLRAKYKGQLHLAHIADSKLIDENGVAHGSASAAARAITNNSVNGLNFWEVQRPSDSMWQKLASIPRVAQ